ncbi:MAG: PDZ domain-containing protein [Steroidobacteraceae bacterium]
MKRYSLTLTSLAALVCAGGVTQCAPAAAAADPPASASTAGQAASRTEQRSDQARSQADLEEQLAAARKQLEDAAKQVAELSAQLGRPLIERFMTLAGGGPDRAIIGVQLDDGAAGRGALVREVSPGGPAAEAGVRAGDLITAINGTQITGADAAGQVIAVMRGVKPDSKVTLRVLRGGATRDLTVVPRPGPMYFVARGLGGPQLEGLARLPPAVLIHGPLGDMELVTLTPQLGRYFGSDKGVLVVRAPPGLKLEDGDVILSIDGRQPLSGSHATRILGSYQPGEKLTMRVIRMRKTLSVESAVPERAGGAPQMPDGPGSLQLPTLPPLPPPPGRQVSGPGNSGV